MRYVQIRAFHYVAIYGGFSRAADALCLTQPAISDQVRKLESENDVRLFDRHSKKVALTPAGDRLLQITRRMFEAEESVADFLSESRSIKTGQINLMADSVHHITAILMLFRQNYPDVFISVKVGNSESILNALRNYDADVGVLGNIPNNQ
ncbi:MAG: DNA-binding transcriptional LysR family regulator, partial [Parvicella sp.]